MLRVANDNLKIVQWNCKSIKAAGRTEELKVLICKDKPHVACISETWLNQDSNPIIITGYKVLRKDRTDRGEGAYFFLLEKI